MTIEGGFFDRFLRIKRDAVVVDFGDSEPNIIDEKEFSTRQANVNHINENIDFIRMFGGGDSSKKEKVELKIRSNTKEPDLEGFVVIYERPKEGIASFTLRHETARKVYTFNREAGTITRIELKTEGSLSRPIGCDERSYEQLLGLTAILRDAVVKEI